MSEKSNTKAPDNRKTGVFYVKDQTREAGADIVNISQVFARSGTLQVSFADSGITSPADFAGKTIGNWGYR